MRLGYMFMGSYLHLVLLSLSLLITDNCLSAISGMEVTKYGAVPNDAGDDADAFRRAFESGGHEIRVPAGEYILRNLQRHIPLHSGQSLLCAAGAILRIPADSVTEQKITKHGYIFRPVFAISGQAGSVQDVRVMGCKFVVEQLDVTPILIDKENAIGVEIDGVTIDGKGSKANNQAAYGILVNNASRLTITNTTISYTRHAAIVARLPRDCLIRANRILYSGVDASYPFHDPGSANYQQHYWNTAGISLAGALRCEILENLIDKTGGVGIILRGGTSDCAYNRIADNRLTNIGKGGIGIGINTGGTGSTIFNIIEGNMILGYMQRWPDAGINLNHRGPTGEIHGIVIRNNIIDLAAPGDELSSYPIHNEFDSTYGAQILIDPSATGQATSIQIFGNILRNSIGPAIAAKSLNNSEIAENIISNAARGGASGNMIARMVPNRYPVVVTHGTGVDVRQNKIYTKVLPAIRFQGERSKVIENQITRCEPGPIDGNGVSIEDLPNHRIRAGYANRVEGNVLESDAQQGAGCP